MSNLAISLLVAITATGAIVMFFYAATSIGKSIPKDQREYMDPLPLSIKLLWPLINFFAYYVGERLGVEYLEKIRVRLKRAGLGFLMTPQQFFGLKMVSMCITAIAGWYVLAGLNVKVLHVLLIIMVIGYLLPELHLHDRRKEIDKEIVRSLPVYLDFLTMSVEAGMNLNGAIMQAAQKGPKGHLNHEFQLVIRDIKAGGGKIEALQ